MIPATPSAFLRYFRHYLVGPKSLSDGFDIRARLFDVAGDPIGGGTALDFIVNPGRTTYEQYEATTAPVEAPLPGFLVAWTSIEHDGSLTVRANFLSIAGAVVGDDELILPWSMGSDQFAASAASDAADPLQTVVAVAWTTEPAPPPDGQVTAIAGVRVAVSSVDHRLTVLSVDDVLLNTTFPDVQETPSAAFGASGALALVWTDWSGIDGSGGLNEVRARYLSQGWVIE
jgi:hypothetical protein